MNLEEMSNCIDMELTEFVKYLYEEIEKLNLKNQKWGGKINECIRIFKNKR